MVKVLVLGSINMDIVAHTAHHPRPGETVAGHNLNYYPGGKGSNQAVAASRLYDNVHLIGKLGTDAFGKTMHAFLQDQNLNLSHLMFTEEYPTGIALIIVDEQSENTIVVVAGSNGEIQVDELAEINFEAGDIVVSQLEVPQPAIYALFKKAKAQGALTMLNAAPAMPLQDGLLLIIDYFIVNETELAYFANSEPGDYDAVLEQARLLRTTPQQSVVVTLGAEGSLCVYEDQVIHVPSFKVKAVDTTGAGDCFGGALAASLASGHSLKDALHFANAAAALSVQKAGASPSMPTRTELEQFLHNNYDKP